MDTDIHANPKAAVASRRARSHSHFTYHHPTVVPRSYIPPPKTITTISTPSQSYVRRPRKEVVVVSFTRPRPASVTDSYRGYAKMAAMADWYTPNPYVPSYYRSWPYYSSAYQMRESYIPLRFPRVVDSIYGPKEISQAEMYTNYLSVYPSRFVYPARYRYAYDEYYPIHRRTARFLAIPLLPKRKFIRKVKISFPLSIFVLAIYLRLFKRR